MKIRPLAIEGAWEITPERHADLRRGAVLDVAADLRTGSPAFGCWEAVQLGDSQRAAVYLAEGARAPHSLASRH